MSNAELIKKLKEYVKDIAEEYGGECVDQVLHDAIAALEAVPVWASGQTLTEDELCDWLTEHAWDASEDSEPVYVVDKEALQGLFKNTILVLAPPTTQSDGG
jgi:hypothetical protein